MWFRHAKRFERRVVRDARLVIMNTDPARHDMVARYPWAADRIVTIRNGSDDESIPSVSDDGQFRIRFAGASISIGTRGSCSALPAPSYAVTG